MLGGRAGRAAETERSIKLAEKGAGEDGVRRVDPVQVTAESREPPALAMVLRCKRGLIHCAASRVSIASLNAA